MSVSDLLDDIFPATPQRRWTDLHEERRGNGRPSPNGHISVGTYPHVCAGCGREFHSNRRQAPGQRTWCGRPECKKAAGAERAREFRERKKAV